MQILVQTTLDPRSGIFNWESFPLTPKAGWVLIDIDGDVNGFLLGKKFVDNELVAMTPEEAEAQLSNITELTSETRYVSPREFLKRFTSDEKNAIYTAAITDIVVAQIKDDLVASEFVDLRHADLLIGMSILVSKGLITEPRKDIILTI